MTAFSVERIEEGESIRGGIIIPDSAKEKPQQGEVISVGKGKSNDEGKTFPLDVKAGDTCSSANTPAPKSSSTAKTSSSCAKKKSSASSASSYASRAHGTAFQKLQA